MYNQCCKQRTCTFGPCFLKVGVFENTRHAQLVTESNQHIYLCGFKSANSCKILSLHENQFILSAIRHKTTVFFIFYLKNKVSYVIDICASFLAFKL